MKFLNIRRDKYLKAAAGLSLFVIFLAFLIFYFKFGSITAPLIIHFDADEGTNLLGEKSDVFKVLFSALIIILINSFLADFLYSRERLLSYLFSFGGLALSVLILIGVSAIMRIN